MTVPPFFHGSSASLKPGDLVLPPEKTGKLSESGRKKNLDLVFFTRDPRSAVIYAGRATQSLGGVASVYLVEPQGPIQELNATPGTTVYAAPYAKVVRRLTLEEVRQK